MLMLSLLLASATPSIHCTATDGDTIRCGPERIRLLGIDAPELPGHCRRGRHCAPGNPFASTRSLAMMLRSASPVIRRVGTDRYGRTLATVRVAGVDLSCHQLASGMATYRPDWDNGMLVASTCPAASRRRIAVGSR